MNWDANKSYVLLLLPLVIAGLLFFMKQRHDPSGPALRIGERTWYAEVADTASSRAKGLSERDSLCADCAMIFRFDAEDAYGFWMRGMRFPLDIAWVRKGKVVHIEHRVPADFSGVMTPSGPADTVLEVNAGDLDAIPVGTDIEVRL